MANFPLPIFSSFGPGAVAETIRATHEAIRESRALMAKTDEQLGKALGAPHMGAPAAKQYFGEGADRLHMLR